MINADWSADLTTNSGFEFSVRPANALDEAALKSFFAGVTPEDLRFRFLTGLTTVGQSQIDAMTDVDHRTTENFLAFVDDGSELIATAMLACDGGMETGEVAMAILPHYKGRGVSWDLLNHVARYAKAKGVKTIQSIERRDHRAAIDMEREMGFVVGPYPGDPALTLVQRRLG
ncbi:GNAT family N-acetyltransferase (plasmid) [Sphingomonas paeninsulae]|uniref:GNAT family N-acetyltransferase n=1 Tax=Sphingomonas paeninsulae TaxID=2319844 RepID=A0A494TAP2_SPHPE|nr:GNAT family N-acetyltransferase [Sphingomonas paeninsulae]AYJ84592.1 GNAT family N-acetyltransferase [Sphingomonas paeninsulae]